MTSSTDRIERQILIEAPRSRVWRALSNAEEFGDWFGMDFKGKTFVAGMPVQGRIIHPGYEHLVCEMLIERIEPEQLFSWRWHTGAIDPGVDYSADPTTLVVFELEELDAGTLVHIVETGFDKYPAGAPRERVSPEQQGVGSAVDQHRETCCHGLRLLRTKRCSRARRNETRRRFSPR